MAYPVRSVWHQAEPLSNGSRMSRLVGRAHSESDTQGTADVKISGLDVLQVRVGCSACGLGAAAEPEIIDSVFPFEQHRAAAITGVLVRRSDGSTEWWDRRV